MRMKNLFITMAVCAISAVSASGVTAVPDTLLIKPQLTNPELKTEKNICAEEGVRDLPGNISTIMRKKCLT